MAEGPLLAESGHSRTDPRPQFRLSGIFRTSEWPLSTQSGHSIDENRMPFSVEKSGQMQ